MKNNIKRGIIINNNANHNFNFNTLVFVNLDICHFTGEEYVLASPTYEYCLSSCHHGPRNNTWYVNKYRDIKYIKNNKESLLIHKG